MIERQYFRLAIFEFYIVILNKLKLRDCLIFIICLFKKQKTNFQVIYNNAIQL